MSNNKTLYLCLKCIEYTPCKCMTPPKPAAKWTSKVRYTVRFTENVNYGAVNESGDFEVEDRDGNEHFDLKSIDEANRFYKAFEPYTREDGALIFSLDVEIVKWKYYYLDGEPHHDEWVYDMEVEHAPKYVQTIVRKMTA